MLAGRRPLRVNASRAAIFALALASTLLPTSAVGARTLEAQWLVSVHRELENTAEQTAVAVGLRAFEHRPVPARPVPVEKLDLLMTTRGERLSVEPFDEQGEPRPEALDALSHLFRSQWNNQVPIDPRLIELLMCISKAFEGEQMVLVSGYRDPGAGTGEGSYHVRGMAADIAILGRRPREIYEVALRLGARGVHVDVRDDIPYKWIRRYR
jgi:uncharacterized protein YcbK (DUF882 family)